MTQLERRRTLYDRFEPWVLSEALTRHDLAVAVALADMCGEDGQDLILAIAFAVAAPQSGHTAVDLRQIREHTLVSAECALVDASYRNRGASMAPRCSRMARRGVGKPPRDVNAVAAGG